MNEVIIQGRPVREPELHRAKDSGSVFCKLRVAVDREYRGKDAPQRTDYFDVLFFGKKGQVIYNNVAKGALMTIRGELQNVERIDNTGKKRYDNNIIGRKFTIHEWLRKHRPLEELDSDFDSELIVPREITNSLYKQLDVSENDEDIPDDLMGRSIEDLCP